MNSFYICITCRHFHDRHDHILRQHQAYLHEFFGLPHLLLDADIDNGLEYSCNGYSPSAWERDVGCILPFHEFNFFCFQNRFNGERLRYNLLHHDCRTEYFDLSRSMPKRPLKLAEHSLIHKHYIALCIARSRDVPTLIVEDDATISGLRQVKNILASIAIAEQEDVFINLVNAPHCWGKSFSDTNLYPVSIARTFTTGAYVVSPDTARKLVEGFFPYSLPIDFHLQRLFKILKIRGYTIGENGIENGSLISAVESTIQ